VILNFLIDKVLAEKGTYALILQAASTRRIQIGRLGKLALHPGFYVYVGSAFGPGGLEARLNHHLKRVIKPHWHIDYLRRYTRVEEIWYTTDTVRREDHWVASMLQLPNAVIAFPGFGASDSQGVSHLYACEGKPEFERFNTIVQRIPNHAPLYVHRRKK
jgi:Uri superfamily endonuclease